MALKGLKEPSLRLILFGGKGGVGKTTCACGTALYLATPALNRGFKTVLVSADPAHSLSDSLGQKIGGQVTEVKGVANLSALEINAEKALARFKSEHDEQIKKILDTGTSLDADDINSVLALPIPGMDEVMGFKTIVDLIDQATFDKYVVDTAPTGHALRLLASPQLLDDWIKVLAKIRWKYRYVVETFAGRYTPDQGDDFLLTTKKAVKRIEDLLRNQGRAEFVAVTVPEAMVILETERLIGGLSKYGIKVKQLVINNVLQSSGCDFCSKKKEEHQRYIKEIRSKFSDLTVTVMPSQAGEIKGIEALRAFSQELFSEP